MSHRICEPGFWDAFYEDGAGKTTFEWYADETVLDQVLQSVFCRQRGAAPAPGSGLSVLEIGCGNSLFLESFFVAESPSVHPLQSLTRMDYSQPCIDQLLGLQASVRTWLGRSASTVAAGGKPRHAPFPSSRSSCFGEISPELARFIDAKCVYLFGDASHTYFPDASFDVIVDKGCFDALFSTGEDDPGGNDAVRQLLSEVSRLLRCDKSRSGCYLLISRNGFDFLNPYLSETDLVVRAVQRVVYSSHETRRRDAAAAPVPAKRNKGPEQSVFVFQLGKP